MFDLKMKLYFEYFVTMFGMGHFFSWRTSSCWQNYNEEQEA